MSTVTPQRLVTVDEFLTLPEDGVDRDLIRGVVVEHGRTGMTRRSREHALAEARISFFLQQWVHSRRKPSGTVYAGEVGCILSHDPPNVVGIDVAWISAEHVTRLNESTTRMIDGAPALAVEILSPSDKQEDVGNKIDDYLANGVQLVWIVDPHFRTVVVHRPGQKPELFNEDQHLAGSDVLPGLDLAVSAIFA